MTTKAQLYLNELGAERAFKEELAAKDAEIAQLREKVEILEAEVRVMRKLPSVIDAALKGKGEGN